MNGFDASSIMSSLPRNELDMIVSGAVETFPFPYFFVGAFGHNLEPRYQLFNAATNEATAWEAPNGEGFTEVVKSASKWANLAAREANKAMARKKMADAVAAGKKSP